MISGETYTVRAEICLRYLDGSGSSACKLQCMSRIVGQTWGVASQEANAVILSISGFGCEAGETIPKSMGGQIVVDNSVGSFGWNRRVSDLLERMTPINQVVTIYMGSDSWAGRCKGVSVNVSGGDTITFKVQGDFIDDRDLTCQLSTDHPLTPSLIADAAGKYAPLVFGADVPVVAIPISTATAGTGRSYAVSTNITDKFQTNCSGTACWAGNENGSWTYIATMAAGSPSTGPVSATTLALNAYKAMAWAMPLTGAGNYILTGRGWTMKGSGVSRTSTCVVRQFLLEVNKTTSEVIRELGSGTMAMTAYDSLNAGGGNFAVHIPFERAMVLDFDKFAYAVGLSVTGWDANDASLEVNSSSYQRTRWTKTDNLASGESEEKWKNNGTQNMPAGWIWRAAGYSVTRSTSAQLDHAGLGLTTVTLTAESDSGETGPLPRDGFDRFQFAPIVQGIADDASGTITGTPSTVLTRLDHILNVLQRVPNSTGTAVSDSGKWDFSTGATRCARAYGTDYNARPIRGYLSGRTTMAAATEALCLQTATRIGVNNTGLMFPHPWGPGNDAPVANIGPHECDPVSYEIGSESSVVNAVNVRFGESAVGLNVEQSAQGGSGNFLGAVSVPTATRFKNYTAISRDIYGVRPAREIDAGCLQTTTAALGLAESYVAQYAHAMKMVAIRVPYALYSTIKMFDVITFINPAFPAFWGTSSHHAKLANEDATGGQELGLLQGWPWVQAARARGIVEGRAVDYAIEGAPTIRLTIRVLDNYPKDPT